MHRIVDKYSFDLLSIVCNCISSPFRLILILSYSDLAQYNNFI